MPDRWCIWFSEMWLQRAVTWILQNDWSKMTTVWFYIWGRKAGESACTNKLKALQFYRKRVERYSSGKYRTPDSSQICGIMESVLRYFVILEEKMRLMTNNLKKIVSLKCIRTGNRFERVPDRNTVNQINEILSPDEEINSTSDFNEYKSRIKKNIIK